MDAVPSHLSSRSPHRLTRTNMLHSSQNKSLNRSKSLDLPRNSHFEAVTAAEVAFRLAQERASLKDNSNASNHVSQNAGQGEALGLARTQSIRFAGPSALKTGGLPITRRAVPTIQEDINSEHESSSVLGRHLLNEFKTLAMSPGQGEYVEENIASQPSSYRRLRKAQSMYNPGETPPSAFTEFGLRICRHPNRRSMQSSASRGGSSQQLEKGVRRSFSFLRGGTDRLSTGNNSYTANDAAIQIARDQFLQQIEDQRQQRSPMFLGSHKERKVPKPFRRTVRSNATNKYGHAVQSPLTRTFANKSKGFNERARSASQTLRRAIRKILGRSPTKDGLLPAQQLSAEKPHYGGSGVQEAMDFSYPPIPSPDVELLRRVDSRETIRCSQPGSPLDKVSARSIRRVASEDGLGYEGSRVTSWTASTAANTIHAPRGEERKRLSVIKEDGGPHQWLSPDHVANDRVNAYRAFRQPARFECADPAAARRVFSALRREIQNNSPQNNTGSQTLGMEEASGPDSAQSLPGASGSEDGNNRSVIVLSGSRDQLGSLFPDKADGEATQPMNYQGRPFQNGMSSYSSPDLARDGYKMFAEKTPQEIADMNEAAPPPQKGPLHEVGGAFFPSDIYIERRGTSPYKLATQTLVIHPGTADFNEKVLEDNQNPQRIGSATLSGSIYSRTSGGHSLLDAGSSSSLATFSKGDDQVGPVASVHNDLQQQVNRSYSGTGGTRRSSNSSGQWRTRLASDMGYWEQSQPADDRKSVANPTGRSGHKRENAQYDGDDVAVSGLASKDTVSKQPLAAAIADKYSPTSLRQAFDFSTPEKRQPSNEQNQMARAPVQQKENKPISIQKSEAHRGFVPRRQWKADHSIESGLGSDEDLSVSLGEMRLARVPKRRMPQVVSPLSRKPFGTNAFVNESVRNRRREMRISEESRDSSAFV